MICAFSPCPVKPWKRKGFLEVIRYVFYFPITIFYTAVHHLSEIYLLNSHVLPGTTCLDRQVRSCFFVFEVSLAGSPFCLVHVPPRHAVFSPISLHLFFKPTISPASLVEPWWLLLVTMIMSSEFCSFLSSSHKAVLHGESEACLVYRKFLSWVHPMLFPLPTHLSLEGKRRFLLVFLLHPSVSLCFHHIIFHVFYS